MNHLVKKDIVVLVGSLRKESYSRKMAEAMKAFAPKPGICTLLKSGICLYTTKI